MPFDHLVEKHNKMIKNLPPYVIARMLIFLRIDPSPDGTRVMAHLSEVRCGICHVAGEKLMSAFGYERKFEPLLGDFRSRVESRPSISTSAFPPITSASALRADVSTQ